MADQDEGAPPPPPPPPPPRRCPVCRRVVTEARFRPFCSARCRQVDLGRWLAGDYAIPAGREEKEEGEA